MGQAECPARSWGNQGSPHLGLLRGVGEGQRVDAAGGQAGLEGLRAVSESDLLLLHGRGRPSCFQEIEERLPGAHGRWKVGSERHSFGEFITVGFSQ